MGRRKKEVTENIIEKPTGWVEGSMPEPVSVLPTAPDPKPTQKVSHKATADQKDPDPVKMKLFEKAKTESNCYAAIKYRGDSFTDALKILKVDNSFDHRKRIAEANGIVNYLSLGVENNKLLKLLVAGKLKIPK